MSSKYNKLNNRSDLRPLAWAVRCPGCKAKAGEPCVEAPHFSQSKKRIYRGYSGRTGMLTRPAFHQSRWRAAHEMSPIDKIAVLAAPNHDDDWPPIEPTQEYGDLVATFEATRELRRSKRRRR